MDKLSSWFEKSVKSFGILLLVLIVEVIISSSLGISLLWFLFADLWLAVVILLFAGMQSVPEQERWLVEVFGKYAYTLKPGFGWVLPSTFLWRGQQFFIMRVREKVDIRMRIIPLFNKDGKDEVKLDFPDASPRLVGVQAFVKVYSPDDAYLTKNDKVAHTGAWRVVYSGRDDDFLIRDALEAALRAYLSSFPSFQEANKGGGSGFNLASRGNQGIPDPDLDVLEDRLHELGYTILEGGALTIMDFDLGKALVEARENIAKAEARATAAGHLARAKSREGMGAFLLGLAQALGYGEEKDGGLAKVTAAIEKDPSLKARVVAFAEQLTTQQLSLDKDALDHIKIDGVSGEFSGLLALVRAAVDGLRNNGLRDSGESDKKESREDSSQKPGGKGGSSSGKGKKQKGGNRTEEDEDADSASFKDDTLQDTINRTSSK